MNPAPTGGARSRARSTLDRAVLLAAEGFGLGRIPVAPGTFGSLGGLLWSLLLIATGRLWLFVAGTIAGLLAAIWLGERAETLLGRKDPGSIVIDEIAAFPLVLLGPLSLALPMPRPGQFLQPDQLILLVLAFGLFRFFDIAKPLGIRRVQSLPGGWGLVVDDILAAGCAGMLLCAYVLLR